MGLTIHQVNIDFVPPAFEFTSLVYQNSKVYTQTNATVTFVPSYSILANSQVLLIVPDQYMFTTGQVNCEGVTNMVKCSISS